MQLGHINITKVEISFTLLLVILIAGTQPFLGGNVQSTGLESSASIRDILLYLIPSLGIIFFGLDSFSKQRFLTNLWPIILVLLYCGLTISWSATPQIAFFRLALLSIMIIAMSVAVYKIEKDRLWNILTMVLATIALINLASVLLIPDAVHRADDITQKLAGTWKGLHLHKNIAGPVAAISTMYFLIFLLHSQRHKLLYLGLFLTSIVFLVGTDSRTSLYLFAFSLLLIIVRRILVRFFGPLIVNIVVINLILTLVLLLIIYVPEFETFVEDGKLFTGRGEVWRSLITYINLHPMSGAGYGSFWRIGFESPIFTLTDGWATKTGAGHSGYLDLAATIGIPGLVLTLIVFLALPMSNFIKVMSRKDHQTEIIFAMFVFAVLHNLFETSLLEPRSPGHVFWTLSIFLLMYKKAPQTPKNTPKTSSRNF